MNDTEQLDGLLRAYRLATALLAVAFSPIEAMRQEQRAVDTAREIADLLVAAGLHPFEMAGVR